MTNENYADDIVETDDELQLESRTLFGEKYTVRVKGDRKIEVRVKIGRLVAIGEGETRTLAFKSILDDIEWTFRREFFAVNKSIDQRVNDWLDKKLHITRGEADQGEETRR